MFNRFVTRLALLAVAGLILPCTLLGQERTKVALSFLPPPLETATYSLGIYDAKTRKIVRRLHEYAPASVFTAGLNGLITSWDGKDDDGKPVPPGRYGARGYAVGEMKVEGKAILGNDWAGDDEALRLQRVVAIALVPDDDGVTILGTTPGGKMQVARYGGEKCALLWHKELPPPAKEMTAAQQAELYVQENRLVAGGSAYQLADGERLGAAATPGIGGMFTSMSGKDDTLWKIDKGVLTQYSDKDEPLRALVPKEGEPIPVALATSKTNDRLFLLEESKGAQRVRGLSWKETTKEGDKSISNWTTFFENTISPNFAPLGPDKTELGAQAEIALVENPLASGKPERLKLAATFDARGSYLATADGLRLRQISQRQNLRAVKLGKNKAANALAFYQSDGAAWDEFSVEGAREIIGFDAGEIDLTATGEKPAAKPAEPDL